MLYFYGWRDCPAPRLWESRLKEIARSRWAHLLAPGQDELYLPHLWQNLALHSWRLCRELVEFGPGFHSGARCTLDILVKLPGSLSCFSFKLLLPVFITNKLLPYCRNPLYTWVQLLRASFPLAKINDMLSNIFLVFVNISWDTDCFHSPALESVQQVQLDLSWTAV